jgi:hypothetical protein
VAIEVDQSEPQERPGRARAAVAAFGRLDTVILNGGVSQRSLARGNDWRWIAG